MNLEEYKLQYSESDSSPGWDAIDSHLKTIYTDQVPKHYPAVPHYAAGGTDPIDGVSVYECAVGGVPHYHFITYGFSELYFNEEAFGKDFSKFGFELSFRLKPYAGDSQPPQWPIYMLQNIARYVYKSGNWFEAFHVMTALGPIRLDTDTSLHALLFTPDPVLGEIQSPHGKVEFLQVFGITQKELDQTESILERTEALAAMHQKLNPYLITDLERRDS